MRPIYKKFKTNFELLINGKKNIAMAVSGGSDSMAMALLCNQYMLCSDIKITALTVDHGLRPEAREEAKKVGLWLKTYGIEHHILCWDGIKKPSNIQSEARKARYRLMAEFCASESIGLLAIAHTTEDQAETVLMRIMRGSGIDGLAGIPNSSNVFGIKVIRPLLNLTRTELREYLQYNHQEWVEDPSNENTKYKRTEMRKFIKASNEPEILVKRLSDTASHMQRAKDYIEAQICKNLAGIFIFNDMGYYTVDINRFKTLHQEERLRALAAALWHVSGQDYRPRFKNLLKLDGNIINDKIGSGCTLWGCEISYSKKKNAENILFIYREAALANPAIAVLPNSQIIWDGRFICDVGNLDAENLNVGCLGIEGYNFIKNISANHNHIPKFALHLPKKIIYMLPALRTLEKVLAVPHIGYYDYAALRQLFFSKAKDRPGLF